MAGTRTALMVALGLSMSISAAALLSGCDNGPSAVASRQAAGTQMADEPRASTASARGDSGGASQVDHRNDPAPMLDGKAIWAASRRYSAEEAAQRAFDRNGEAFEARTVSQFARKARAFVEHPPAGTQTLTRTNGDTLFYDPKGNVFAVADKDGAPRTMFKPDDGADYWQQQKDSVSRQTAAASRRARSSNDDA